MVNVNITQALLRKKIHNDVVSYFAYQTRCYREGFYSKKNHIIIWNTIKIESLSSPVTAFKGERIIHSRQWSASAEKTVWLISQLFFLLF